MTGRAIRKGEKIMVDIVKWGCVRKGSEGRKKELKTMRKKTKNKRRRETESSRTVSEMNRGGIKEKRE